MARDIPATYNPPDPDRSFVTGTEDIADYSGGSDPHSGGDIAAAVRFLYADAVAHEIVKQLWPAADAFGESAVAFGAQPDVRWYAKADEAFTDYEVTIDYEAHAANAAGFKIVCADNAEEITLPSVAAGGAVRRIRAVWTDSDIDTLAGQDSIQLQLFTAGDGVNANQVRGVFIRRVPLTGAIPAGKHYNGGFITPDSSQWQPDKPLTGDKNDDIRACLATLLAERERTYLCYGFTGTTTHNQVATLMNVHETAFGRAHEYFGLSTSAQNVYVNTDPEGFDGFRGFDIAHAIATQAKEGVRMSPAGKVIEAGPGYTKQFGQYVLRFDTPNDMVTVAVVGP